MSWKGITLHGLTAVQTSVVGVEMLGKSTRIEAQQQFLLMEQVFKKIENKRHYLNNPSRNRKRKRQGGHGPVHDMLPLLRNKYFDANFRSPTRCDRTPLQLSCRLEQQIFSACPMPHLVDLFLNTHYRTDKAAFGVVLGRAGNSKSKKCIVERKRASLRATSAIRVLDLLAIRNVVFGFLPAPIDINTQDKIGMTSLHYAFFYRNLEIAKMILQSDGIFYREKIDVNLRNQNGDTLLHKSLYPNGPSDPTTDPIHIVKLLVNSDGSNFKSKLDVNIKNRWSSMTPLHVAIFHGRFEVAKLLLEHNGKNFAQKIDVNAQDEENRTVLHVLTEAVVYFHLGGNQVCQLVEMLLNNHQNFQAPMDLTIKGAK